MRFLKTLLVALTLWRSAQAKQKCRTKFQDFKCDLEFCSSRCLARPKCVASCMQGKGYDCEDCYGIVAQCTAKSCWRQCVTGCNEKCAACSRQKCSPALADCLGVPLRKIPGGCCADDDESDEESKQKARAFWRRIGTRKHEVLG
mmetsp:Transcript_8982/g.33875  ORF Transcript_8982/g.33875 Transcript_8982/m.33875 type:complete len:145 (+) Transcript_8982:1538-1972(+)